MDERRKRGRNSRLALVTVAGVKSAETVAAGFTTIEAARRSIAP